MTDEVLVAEVVIAEFNGNASSGVQLYGQTRVQVGLFVRLVR